jgi:uncharacterized protein YggE
MTRLRSVSLLLGVLVLLVAASSWLSGGRTLVSRAHAAPQGPPGDQTRDRVLVTGTGQVLGVPDTLRASFGVESRARTVEAAFERANAAMTRMRDALVRAGVARADLQTANLDITSQGENGRITGYTMSEGLTAKIRNIPRAGPTIAAAIAAAGNDARLFGVSFAIEEDNALLAAARRKAFADAQAKAELYAAEAGRSLGEVASVTEAGPGSAPAPQAATLAASPDVPVEPGRQQVAVTVTVAWALD